MAALAEGVLQSMVAGKLKVGMALLLGTALVAAGTGALAHQVLATKQSDAKQRATLVPGARGMEPAQPRAETQARTDRPPIPQPPSAGLEQLHLAAAQLKAKPLSSLQKTIIAGASYRLAHDSKHPLEAAALSQAQTTVQADIALAKHEFELLRSQ